MAPLDTNGSGTNHVPLTNGTNASAGFHTKVPTPASSLQEHNTHSHDESLVPYEDELHQVNSKLQLAWTSVMDKDYYSSSVSYNNVQCLLLRWEDDIDDLQVRKEVAALQDVLENTYNFGVTEKKIRKLVKKGAQTQINAIVASWVDDHDYPKTLLLVYFAGHGKPNVERTGELNLMGYRYNVHNPQDHLNRIVWNNTESNLRDIQSDVLEIFDCCHAGYLAEARGHSNQAFEYIAACSSEDTTAGPGKESFTAALIWALKDLAHGAGRFTTANLLERVRNAPDFPKDQKPTLSSRRVDHSNERIVLHPLIAAAESDAPRELNPNGTIKNNIVQQDVVTLKFIFDARPDSDDIKILGDGLNHIVSGNKLNVNQIIWGGIQPRTNDAVFRAVSFFQAGGRKRILGGLPPIRSRTIADVATLVQHLKEEVAETVHEQVHEEAQAEFEAHTAASRSKSRLTD